MEEDEGKLIAVIGDEVSQQRKCKKMDRFLASNNGLPYTRLTDINVIVYEQCDTPDLAPRHLFR